MDALRTDRYELAMLGAYLREGLAERRAVFELSLRRLPPHRRFLLVCGIERVVRYIRQLRFESREIEYLQQAPGLRDVLTEPVVRYLREFSFRGDVWAMADGDVAFASEPILRVEASLAEAQVLETFVLGVVNHETKVASKAARVVIAAAERPVYEFGARRIDPYASAYAARAAYVAGCAGTSCEQAGIEFGVPVSGTCAHSYVLAHVDDGEEDAFRSFAGAFPSGTTLLIDTFETHRGALRAAQGGPSVRGVRIDSGDLASLGRDVRSILDAAGRRDVKIIASDEMDEYRIDSLVRAGAPYDGFGVGTSIVLSTDAPSFGAVYKLVEIDDRRGVRVPVAKRAPGKASYGGAKQVHRSWNSNRTIAQDIVAHVDERVDGEPMLRQVIRGGALVGVERSPSEATRDARSRAIQSISSLPAMLRVIAREERGDELHLSPVVVSETLRKLPARED